MTIDECMEQLQRDRALQSGVSHYVRRQIEAVVEAEREICAKIAEDGLSGFEIAEAIRARGQR